MRDKPLIVTIDPGAALRSIPGSTGERLCMEPVEVPVMMVPVEPMLAPLRMMEDLEMNISRGERRHGVAGRWRKKRLFRP